jgi:hypothetical protein
MAPTVCFLLTKVSSLPQNEYNNEVMLDLQYVPNGSNNISYYDFRDFAPLSVGARLNALAPTQELVDNYLMLNGKNRAKTDLVTTRTTLTLTATRV